MNRPRPPGAFPGARPLTLILLSACLALPPVLVRAEPMGAQGDDFLYRVEPLDTLEQVARRYTLQAEHWPTLQRLNQIDDPHRLPIGKVLRIPLSLIPEQPATATAVHVTGQVTADGHPVRPGDVLHAGQSLRSSSDGTATLRLADQSLLTLPPGATVQLQRLQSFQGTGLTDTQISIDRGTLESTVAPAGTGVGRFEVRTPATVTGVRGTRLRVHADASGSRHEVLQGHAAIAGPTGTEQSLGPDRGAAYDTSGTLLGTQPLLPPPQGLKMADGGGQRLVFEPIPNAVAYTVRVTLDADGARLESSQRVTAPGIPLHARGGGPRHLFVRGIDALGIEGRDATLAVDSLRAGLTASDGAPVLTADGAPVLLD